MPLRQGTRSCASDVVGLRSRATGVVRLEAVAAVFACSRLFVRLLTSYGRATPDARERIPTGAGGAARSYHFYAAANDSHELACKGQRFRPVSCLRPAHKG